jgi:hypothetical protein
MFKFAADTLLLIFSLFFMPGFPQVCEAVDIAFGDDFNDGEDDGWL